MKDPVLCEDSHTYERSAIMSIRNSLSPMTRQPIDKSKLIPNRGLKSAIDRYLSSNTQYQSILIEKQKKEKDKSDQELKVKYEMEQKREQEERRKIDELRRLREERYLQERREKERRIKYEEDQRKE
jgi:hypothetical protein